MYLGGTKINNGDGVKVGSSQLDKIMLGSNQVWINNYAPSAITDFSATSSGSNKNVTVTWTNADGVPTPTYNLYENNVLKASGISSGYVFTSSVKGNNTYKVKAVNVVASVDSNTSTAIVWTDGTSYTRTSTATITAGTHFPANTTITFCGTGGGGGGSQVATSYFTVGGGGHAGSVVTTTASFSFGQQITVTIGGNGARANNMGGNGGTGGTTSISGVISCSGGSGGVQNSSSYAGNGQSRTTCGGTKNNGAKAVYSGWTGYGGQTSGFGNGGAGGVNTSGNGGVGSGGGSNLYFAGGSAGLGGRGEMRLSW